MQRDYYIWSNFCIRKAIYNDLHTHQSLKVPTITSQSTFTPCNMNKKILINDPYTYRFESFFPVPGERTYSPKQTTPKMIPVNPIRLATSNLKPGPGFTPTPAEEEPPSRSRITA